MHSQFSNPAVIPVRIERVTEHTGADSVQTQGAGIRVLWSSGEEGFLSSETLRTNCPCATCNERRGDRSHGKPLSGKSSLLTVLKASAAEELNLTTVWPVGNYAVGMRWADGHDTGIYPYELLRALAREQRGPGDGQR